MKWFFFLGVSILLLACSEKNEAEFKNQFFDSKGNEFEVEMDRSFETNKVQFSTGKYSHFLRGEISIDGCPIVLTISSDESFEGNRIRANQISVQEKSRKWKVNDFVLTAEYGSVLLTVRSDEGLLRVKNSITSAH